MRKPEIPALTGLRAIAALMVVTGHYAAAAAPFRILEAPTAVAVVFGLSGFGMTLFFTLSGFVIVYNYLDLPWRQYPLSSFCRFAWLRVSRLYPLLLLFLFISMTPALLETFEGHLWIALHVLSVDTVVPVKLLGGHMPGVWIFNVSWSIGTEFFMYAVFAILMIIASRSILVALIIVVTYIVGILYLMGSPTAFQNLTTHLPVLAERFDSWEWTRWFWYLSPYYRLVEFGLGAVSAYAALRYPRSLERSRKIVGAIGTMAAVSIVAVYAYSHAATVRISIAELQLISALLFAALMLTGGQNKWLNRMLSSRPLTLIGMVSYSLYLFHNFVPASAVLGPPQAFSWALMPPMLLILGTRLLFAVGMAWGLYHLIERPAQTWLRRVVRWEAPGRSPLPVVIAAPLPAGSWA